MQVIQKARKEHRRRYLNGCLAKARQKENEEVERRTLNIIRQEKERARWREMK